ncbi:MAG: hypothetical protein H0U85_10260 [Gemmatimonadales bacterium]|nr:hypothetical protein [Gemmatimonadales bacterium]
MRPVGLVLVLLGIIGLVIGVLAMAGVPLLQPTGSTGDVTAPGAGPILGALLLIVVGLVVVGGRRSRA